MALQPVRIMSPTSPIAVTLRSRIMVLLPSIAHTGGRLLSPFDLASQTSLASQHESTGALPPHARMPRIRRSISATGISPASRAARWEAPPRRRPPRRSIGPPDESLTQHIGPHPSKPAAPQPSNSRRADADAEERTPVDGRALYMIYRSASRARRSRR